VATRDAIVEDCGRKHEVANRFWRGGRTLANDDQGPRSGGDQRAEGIKRRLHTAIETALSLRKKLAVAGGSERTGRECPV